jgi:hypothetical protein
MMTVLDENLYYRVVADRVLSGEVVLHCHIKKWSHTVYKYLMSSICTIQTQLREPLYAPRMDQKQEKFLSMMGFYPTDKALYTLDGDQYKLFKFEVH